MRKVTFSLITNIKKARMCGEGDGSHTVCAHEGQQWVRAGVRAAEKALKGDDRQTYDSFIIVRCYSKRVAL